MQSSTLLFLFIFWRHAHGYNRLSNFVQVSDFMDVCMDGLHHKKTPSEEELLHGNCRPWSKKSCCFSNVTARLHASNLYEWNYDHCKEKKMSEKCKQHFLKNSCFYECSPNVGPWLVQVKMKIRSERFYKIPLCESQCKRWWQDCKEDLTCVKNWNSDFNRTNGHQCPRNAKCETFAKKFHNHTSFCELIWDHSYQVVDEAKDNRCMTFEFSVHTNTNDRVCREKAQEMQQYLLANTATSRGAAWSVAFPYFCLAKMIAFVWINTNLLF